MAEGAQFCGAEVSAPRGADQVDAVRGGVEASTGDGCPSATAGYEDIRDSERFEAMLNDLLTANGFAAYLAPGSERRVERFVSQAP